MGEELVSGVADATEKSRRRLLQALGAGGVAAAVSQWPRRDAAAGHDGTNVLHLGEGNVAPPFTTELTATAQETATLRVRNLGTGGGAFGLHVQSSTTTVVAETVTGVALLGVSEAVFDDSEFGGGSGTGVLGKSGSGVGVNGVSVDGDGVNGHSDTRHGGSFSSISGNGVSVLSETGVGGEFRGDTGVGVAAISSQGLALRVQGRAAFSTAGSAVVAPGQTQVSVSHPGVTAQSHISVTFVSDPGDRSVRWVQRNPGSGFTVHLAGVKRGGQVPATITFLIVEPA